MTASFASFCLCAAMIAAPLPNATIGDLIDALGHAQIEKREEAYVRLASIGDPALPSLAAAAKDHGNAEVRRRAAQLIEAIPRGELAAWGAPGGYWFNRVEVLPNGRYALVTGGGVLRIDMANGRELRRDLELQFARCGLAVSKDGSFYVTGHQSEPVVRMMETMEGKPIRTFNGHTSGVWGVALAPDEKVVATGSIDRTIRFWDISSGKELRQAKTNFPVRSLAYAPDGKQLASGHWNGPDFSIHLWNAETAAPIRSLKGHNRDVVFLAYHPKKNELISAAMDGPIIVWDAENAKELRRMAHEGGVYGGALSKDGSLLLTAGFGDRSVRLWDVESGKELKRFTGHQNAVLGVAFVPGETQAISCDAQSRIRLWRLPDRK